ncbi:TPA: lactate dehydrogenase [Neisseria meningitidis]
MNINELGARIDRPTIRELIAYATCRNRPISNSTLLHMEKDGRIPCRLKTPLTSPV